MWHNIISPLNDRHRFHNSYTHTHHYLSSVSVNTTISSPSAHCCSLRMNSTRDLAYEAPDDLRPHISPRYLCMYSSPLYAVISICTDLPSVFDNVRPQTASGSFACWEHSLLSLAPQRWLPDSEMSQTLLQVFTSLHVSLSNNFPQRQTKKLSKKLQRKIKMKMKTVGEEKLQMVTKVTKG